MDGRAAVTARFLSIQAAIVSSLDWGRFGGPFF